MNRLLYRLAERIARSRTRDRISVYHGVAVRDSFVADAADHHSQHKAALVEAVQEHTNPGDSVVCVGGGRGVVPVWAARAGASVQVFEAAREMVELAWNTMHLNEVADSVRVRHAIVEQAIDVYGSADCADLIPVAGVPDADVLVLDCEGAELAIHNRIDSDRFGTIITETHPEFGSDTETVCRITGGEVAAPDSHDGHVVVA